MFSVTPSRLLIKKGANNVFDSRAGYLTFVQTISMQIVLPSVSRVIRYNTYNGSKKSVTTQYYVPNSVVNYSIIGSHNAGVPPIAIMYDTGNNKPLDGGFPVQKYGDSFRYITAFVTASSIYARSVSYTGTRDDLPGITINLVCHISENHI